MRYVAIHAVLASILVVATTIQAEPTTQPTGPAATQPAPVQRVVVYAAIVRPGPTWQANRAAGRANDMVRHFEYVSAMRSEGKLLFGGPFTDGAGGLLVYRAANIDQARAYMDADPATQEKIFEYDLHPWSLNAADLPQREAP